MDATISEKIITAADVLERAAAVRDMREDAESAGDNEAPAG